MKYCFYYPMKHGFPIKDNYPLLLALVNGFIDLHTNGIGKKVVFGNSSGATMAFCMVNHYTSFFQALVPIGTASIPDDAP